MFLINGVFHCLEPEDVASALIAEGLSTDVIAQCNSWTVHHGPKPNYGYFLMSYDDYAGLLDPSSVSSAPSIDPVNNLPTVSLVIKDDTGASATYQSLTLTNAINVLGKKNQSGSVVMIKLEDGRYWMSRFGCEGACYNYLGQNDLNLSSATSDDYYQAGTINPDTSDPWLLGEVLENLLSKFRTAAANGNFGVFALSSPAPFTDKLHDMQFEHESVLEAISKICQAYRLHFTVRKNGAVRFSSEKGSFPTSFSQISLTDNLSNKILPDVVRVYCKSHEYELFDNASTTPRPPSVYIYDYLTPTATTDGSEFITVPYLKKSDIVGNAAEVDNICETIGDNFINILDNQAKSTAIRGFVEVENNIGFGLDKVVYFVRGAGLITICYSFDPNNHYLNYRNPEFSYDASSSGTANEIEYTIDSVRVAASEGEDAPYAGLNIATVTIVAATCGSDHLLGAVVDVVDHSQCIFDLDPVDLEGVHGWANWKVALSRDPEATEGEVTPCHWSAVNRCCAAGS